MYLPTGTELNNRYKVEDVLGHGGFGITYSALDKILNVKVAVKEYLPRQLATRGEGQTKVSTFTGEARGHYQYGLKKFLEEAQSVAQFSHHPNIVSARDYFEGNNTAYMVMEYIEGVTLKEYLGNKGGRVSYEEARAIMMPVMDALREVHQAGLLHRDISPDNIYITRTGQVKVLDFGAARYYAGEHSKSLSVILKPGFAPEEQYRSSGKQGTWTDVYAVGATLYKAVTGKTPPDALDRKEEDTLDPPSKLGVSIPANDEQALLKAMAIKAGNRFKNMGAFQAALTDGGAPQTMAQSRPAMAQDSAMAPTEAVAPIVMEERPSVAPQASAPPPPVSQIPSAGDKGIPNLKMILGALGGIVAIAGVGIIIWSVNSKNKVAEIPRKPPEYAIPAKPKKDYPEKTPKSPPTLEVSIDQLIKDGAAFIKDKEYENARSVLEQARGREPKNARVLLNLGIAYLHLERYQDAIDSFEKGIRLKGDNPLAYRYLGEAYGKKGNYGKAIEALEKTVRLNSKDSAAHFMLGKAYVQMGYIEQARKSYESLKELDRSLASELLDIINKAANSQKVETPEPKSKKQVSEKAIQQDIDRKAKEIEEARKAKEEAIKLKEQRRQQEAQRQAIIQQKQLSKEMAQRKAQEQQKRLEAQRRQLEQQRQKMLIQQQQMQQEQQRRQEAIGASPPPRPPSPPKQPPRPTAPPPKPAPMPKPPSSSETP